MLLNADMGESETSWFSGRDAELLPYLDAVNISCGFHAGTAKLIEETIRVSQSLNLKIGAHPGYPDQANFGRIYENLTPRKAAEIVRVQLDYFFTLTDRMFAKVEHVKAHGAFYNQLASDYKSSLAFCEAVGGFGKDLVIYGLPDSATEKAAGELGLTFLREGFADRAYTDSGQLVDRKLPGALYKTIEEVVNQVANLRNGYVLSSSGNQVPMQIQTVCVHGDSPEALEMVKAIRNLQC